MYECKLAGWINIRTVKGSKLRKVKNNSKERSVNVLINEKKTKEKSKNQEKWEEDLLDATDNPRVSHTPSPDTTEVSPIQESVSTTPEKRKLVSRSSLTLCTLSLMKKNKLPQKHSKPHVLLPTRT